MTTAPTANGRPPRPPLQLLPPTVHVWPWVDEAVERYGHRADSRYAELFWLPVVGPTGLWAARRLADLAERQPGAAVDLGELGLALGVGDKTGPKSVITHTIHRLQWADLAHLEGVRLSVRVWMPPLTPRRAARLPAPLAAQLAAWPDAQPAQRPGPMVVGCPLPGPHGNHDCAEMAAAAWAGMAGGRGRPKRKADTVTCPANADRLHRADFAAAAPTCLDCGGPMEPSEPGSPQWLLNVARFDEARRAAMAEATFVLGGWFDDKAFRVFTIGLARGGHPEIVVTAPDDEVAAGMVSRLADLAADGAVLKGGDTITVRNDGGEAVMEWRLIDLPAEVTRDSDLFNQAHSLNPVRAEIPAVQAVWPGRHRSTVEGPPLRFPTNAEPWNDQPLLADPWWPDDQAESSVQE